MDYKFRADQVWKMLLGSGAQQWSYDHDYDNVVSATGRGWKAMVWSLSTDGEVLSERFASPSEFIAECRQEAQPHALRISIGGTELLNMEVYPTGRIVQFCVEGDWLMLVSGNADALAVRGPAVLKR
jgi:hypothetical protein